MMTIGDVLNQPGTYKAWLRSFAFQAWKRQVNDILEVLDLGTYDFPELPWRAAFDNGVLPYEAAYNALLA